MYLFSERPQCGVRHILRLANGQLPGTDVRHWCAAAGRASGYGAAVVGGLVYEPRFGVWQHAIQLVCGSFWSEERPAAVGSARPDGLVSADSRPQRELLVRGTVSAGFGRRRCVRGNPAVCGGDCGQGVRNAFRQNVHKCIDCPFDTGFEAHSEHK